MTYKDLTPPQKKIAKDNGYCGIFFTPNIEDISKGIENFAETLDAKNRAQFYLYISQIQNHYAIKLALANTEN